jgi:hypothetical protein
MGGGGWCGLEGREAQEQGRAAQDAGGLDLPGAPLFIARRSGGGRGRKKLLPLDQRWLAQILCVHLSTKPV